MAATNMPPPTDMLSALGGSAARRRRERMVSLVLMAAAGLSVVITLGIVLTVLFEAIQFLGQIDLSQLFTIGWFPRRGMFDIPTILIGSILVTVIAMALAIPIGLLSAIYLS